MNYVQCTVETNARKYDPVYVNDLILNGHWIRFCGPYYKPANYWKDQKAAPKSKLL